MNRTVGTALLVGIAAIVTLAGVAFGSSREASASTVKVTLAPGGNNGKLTPAPSITKAGQVTFIVTNQSSRPHKVGGVIEAPEGHELVVLKTTLAPGKLRLKSSGQFAVETGRVGQPVVLDPAKTATVTLNLTAGKYVLLCNLLGHYGSGQYAAFKVIAG